MSLQKDYLLESTRDARLLNRWRLLQNLSASQIPENCVPAMLPHAWHQDPQAPEQRRLFTLSIREMLDTSEVAFSSIVSAILKGSASSPVDHQHIIRRRARTLSNESRSLHARGFDDGKDARVQFHVFVKSNISEDTLTSFLETTPEPYTNAPSYRYIFPDFDTSLEGTDETSSASLVFDNILSHNAKHIGNSSVNGYPEMPTRAPPPPPAQLILQQPQIIISSDTSDCMEVSHRPDAPTRAPPPPPPAPSTPSFSFFDNSFWGRDQAEGRRSPDVSMSDTTSLSDSTELDMSSPRTESSFTSLGSVSSSRYHNSRYDVFSSMAKSYLSQPNPPRFQNMSLRDIHRAWREFIEPHTQTRSLQATHAYIVLDEQTATDGNTVLVVAETDGRVRHRRVDFVALREELVLKGLESLCFDLYQFPGDATGTIRGPIYEQAQVLENIEHAKKTENERMKDIESGKLRFGVRFYEKKGTEVGDLVLPPSPLVDSPADTADKALKGENKTWSIKRARSSLQAERTNTSRSSVGSPTKPVKSHRVKSFKIIRTGSGIESPTLDSNKVIR